MRGAIRFLLYTLAVLLYTASLPLVVSAFGIDFFAENGPVEWIELALVGASASVFAAAASRDRLRRVFVVLACVAALAAFRELDAILHAAVPWLGWKIGYVLALYAAFLAYTDWQALRAQLREFFGTRAFGMMWAAFIVAVPVAQLVGHGPLLSAAMGEDYAWAYKHMLEEILEVAGYLLLLLAAFESGLQQAAAESRQRGRVREGVVNERRRAILVSARPTEMSQPPPILPPLSREAGNAVRVQCPSDRR